MNFEHYIEEYTSGSDPINWSILNCLNCLKDNDNLIFISDSKQAKKKAKKIFNSINDTFERRKIREFFEKLDHKYEIRKTDREMYKSINTVKVLITKKATVRLGKVLETQERRSNKKMKTKGNVDLKSNHNEMDSSSSKYQEETKMPKRQSTESNDFDDNEIEDAQECNPTEFDIAYHKLDLAKMWTLEFSGRVVKKKEITTSEVKAKLKLEPSHVELLKKYTTDNIKKLRKAFSEPLVSEFDRNLHFDLDFINFAYRGMLFLWEKDVDPFDSIKLEGWYEMCVWSRLINPTFENLDINLVREEGMSLTSSDQKNIKRSVADRKIIVQKGDGIFKQYKKHIEFGAVEAGRKWEGKNSTKYLTDSLKLCKMIKDVLTQLSIECNGVEDLVRKIQVIGILNRANMIQVAGRLSKSDPLALVLKEVLCVKSIIKQILDIINKKNSVDIGIFLNDSDEQDGSRTPPNVTIPPTFTILNSDRTQNM
ncbi:16690_t:CDS:2 [Funneliformis caledonium]|uniref:16690_t:CDS:1 n=1 Tax=Funneliformis caledonium TaxID=1117310 RepID=A0A9N9F0P5_9GLOM|nr:16690_t:CDS:2 [Funneliformis caledonium]